MCSDEDSAAVQETNPQEVNRFRNEVKNGERGPLLNLDYNETYNEFPIAVLELTELRELNLSNCNLLSIPSSISCLDRLEVLKLRGNDFKEFPTALCQLKSLEILDLAENKISSIPKDIRDLTKLKTLELQSNKFTGELSANISTLSSLQHLNVSKNKLTSIPECFANLTDLQRLLISRNVLEEAPRVLTTLTKLKALDVSYNLLQEFKLDISALEDLDLEGNKLSELSDIVCCRLNSLKRLDVGRNDIEAIPDCLQSLTNLRELWLNHNKFTSFPAVVCKLRSLEKLSISFNKIRTLPNSIAYLDNLEMLELDNCGLDKMMPLSICMLRNLKFLSLGENDITKLPVVFRTSLPNLTHINLANNKNLKMPPVSVYRRGTKAIFNYMDETETKKTIFHKLVFLGNVDAGKSSLTKTMIQGSSHLTDEGETTIVLDKILWTPEENLRLQVYDFGGSEWYCIVQHFFLGTDSLVCLVVSLTDYTEDSYSDCVEKWLNIIQARAPRAKLFIVLTHTDMFHTEEVATKQQSILKMMHAREELQVKKVNDEIIRLQQMGEDAATAIDRLQKSLSNRLVLPDKIYAISSKNLENIDVLKCDLLKTAKEVGGVIPISWLQLYDVLHCSELSKTKSFLSFQDVEQMANEANKDFQARHVLSPVFYRKHSPIKVQHSVDLSSGKIPRQRKCSENNRFLKPIPIENDEEIFLSGLQPMPEGESMRSRLQNILSFFHSSGDLLWYEGNKEIRDYVFHKQSFVIDLLKSIFSERSEVVAVLPSLQRLGMTSKSFERAIDELHRKGIMSVRLLKGMLERCNLEDKLVDATVQLLIHFGLCFTEEVQDKRITKLHFPWFLGESRPPEASSMLMEPPQFDNCWRFILEYDFLLRSPPALFETASVHIHRVVHDEMSIKHWKNGVYAILKHSKILLYRSEEPETETISFHVEGENTDELWSILTKLHRLFRSMLDCWPGILLEMWLVCPHCTKNGFRKPHRFDGENIDKCCPEGEDFVTCKNDDRVGGIPVRLIYPMQASASTDIVNQTHMDKVAYRIGSKWRSLGRALLLDDCLLDQIDADNHRTKEKAYQVVLQWKERSGAKAQLKHLLKALNKLEQRAIIEELTRPNTDRDRSYSNCL